MILGRNNFKIVLVLLAEIKTLQQEFSKYNLRFLALKDLFDAFFLASAINGGRVWSLTFFTQVCINYLNSFLMESKTASTRATIEIRTILKAGFGIKVQKKGARQPFLSVGACKKATVSLLLPVLAGRIFQRGLQ